MASIGGDKRRRLRARGAAPLTRSALVAASFNVSNNAAIASQVEAPRRPTTTTATVALKRAAALDENNRCSGIAPLRQAKKRAALANLTNSSNIPSRNTNPPLKPPVKLKIRVASTQSREADVNKENQSIHGKTSEINIPLAAQDNGNARLERETCGVDGVKVEPEAPLLACVATQTSPSSAERGILSPLKDVKPVFRKGYCIDEHLEAEGWSSKSYINIDDSTKDPQMCSSYASEIYFYLQMAELKRRPVQNFMEVVQQDINASMRSILVDWLVEVAEEYKLVPDTLYLTVAYIDRFLSGNIVNRQRLQLLGVACMLIASYEDFDNFSLLVIKNWQFTEGNIMITNLAFAVSMRRYVPLKLMNFATSLTIHITVMRRTTRAAQAGQKTNALQLEFLGNYLAELTLVEYGFLQYLPSMIASSAVFLAKVTLNPTMKPWNSTLQYYSGYKPSQLVDCVKALYNLQCNRRHCTLPAIREKYKHEKFKSVANLPPPVIIPLEYFDDLNESVL